VVESWRTERGLLVTEGLSKAEVLNRAGPPDLKDRITEGVDVGQDGDEPETRDVWYYYTPGEIYEVHFVNAQVVRIEWSRRY
jgi:hypothetical protein